MSTMMRQINMISRAAGVFRTDKLAITDLNACHHSYVLAICHHPGFSQEELAHHICINKSNVARHLSYLEERGYVERRPDVHDKRQIRVYPTERMLAVLPAVQAVAEDWNEYLAEGLSEEENRCFYATLAKIAKRARQYVVGKDEKME